MTLETRETLWEKFKSLDMDMKFAYTIVGIGAIILVIATAVSSFIWPLQVLGVVAIILGIAFAIAFIVSCIIIWDNF